MERTAGTARSPVDGTTSTWLADALTRSATCVLLVGDDHVVRGSVGDTARVLGVADPTGLDVHDASAAVDADRLAGLFSRVIARGGTASFEGRFRFGDAGRVLEVVLADTRAAEGLLTATVTDVTAARHAQQLLATRATFDPLTGLFSRPELLVAARRHAGAAHGEAAMVVVDLARFRLVNEAHGPVVGDRLLVAIGHRLREALGPDDVVARLGGDEFAALVVPGPGGRSVDPLEAAARCQAAVHAGPVSIGETLLQVRAWIGSQTLGAGDDPARCLQSAVSAVAEARETGRRIVVADASLRRRAATRADLLADLEEALDAGQIRMAYQPIVDPRDGRVLAAEALARWEHPRHGMVSPTEFIPLAEESGAIQALGRVALERCLDARDRLDEVWADPPDLAVNVSALQLTEGDWPAVVAERLAARGRDGRGLTFELTESIAHQAVEVVAALRGLGARVVIDDFGTGWSSLSLLAELDVDGLKVDRSFIRRLTIDPEAATVVRGVLALAEALGLQTTVEGVETTEQRDVLLADGVTSCQGHLWHPPLTLDELLALAPPRVVG